MVSSTEGSLSPSLLYLDLRNLFSGFPIYFEASFRVFLELWNSGENVLELSDSKMGQELTFPYRARVTQVLL